LGGAANLNELSGSNHHFLVTAGSVLEAECRDLIQAFFRLKRAEPGGPWPRASNSAKPVDARVLRCKICSMAYELPKLPYAYAALAPHIDARTMEIHHTKHHQAYITNATKLLEGQPALAPLDVNALIADLSKVPEAIRTGLRNNAGGHSNHSFFWTILGPGKGGAPKGELAAAIS